MISPSWDVVTDILITKKWHSNQVSKGDSILGKENLVCRSREAQESTETLNPAGRGRWSQDPANPTKAGTAGALGGAKKPWESLLG